MVHAVLFSVLNSVPSRCNEAKRRVRRRGVLLSPSRFSNQLPRAGLPGCREMGSSLTSGFLNQGMAEGGNVWCDHCDGWIKQHVQTAEELVV